MKLPAEVTLDAEQGVEHCSRWAEREDCTVSCAPQIRFSAEQLEEFAALYENKPCSACGTPLSREDWYQSRLSVLAEDTGAGKSVPVLGPTQDPICATCYAARE